MMSSQLYRTSDALVRGGIICGVVIGWIAFMGVVVVPVCGALVRWWFL
jgi:hypothetical protein